MVCLLHDSISSSYSDFGSYDESVHESGMGREFKVFNNILYDEEYDSDKPTTCPNIYKATLHGIINPLFGVQIDLSDLGDLDMNVDLLSYCCRISDYSSTLCDSDYGLDSLVGEVLDEANFEDQPILDTNFFVITLICLPVFHLM